MNDHATFLSGINNNMSDQSFNELKNEIFIAEKNVCHDDDADVVGNDVEDNADGDYSDYVNDVEREDIFDT